MFSYINADMEWEIKTIEVPRRTKLSKALEKFDTGVKFDDAKSQAGQWLAIQIQIL